ncbi:hypothetical protein TRFO_17788 [Tritrichomonas foetus]|uniref:Uncharacterized protein n=1 Tax=Tritrichomonas foetus TaxID=1144522 RepID=A0A1J4KM81_9EUKA|nr:hypothetical protein TRFO_17788 [Tritrichomonas foetus]|eukprot:OHT12409.1 hypothetical protein TRFO_17788 [Tritrichomonas foetus]
MFMVNFTSSDEEDDYPEKLEKAPLSLHSTLGPDNTPLISISELNEGNISANASESIFVLNDSRIDLRKSGTNSLFLSRSSIFQISSKIKFFYLNFGDKYVYFNDPDDNTIFTAKESKKKNRVIILPGKASHFHHVNPGFTLIYDDDKKNFHLHKGDKNGEIIQKITHDKKTKEFTADFSYSYDEVLKRWLRTKTVLDQAILFTDHDSNPPLLTVRFGDLENIEVECSLIADPHFVFSIVITVYIALIQNDLIAMPL